MEITVFLTGKKKKKKKNVKRYTVGMHNATAQIGLGTNSRGDVSLEMEKAPLLQ